MTDPPASKPFRALAFTLALAAAIAAYILLSGWTPVADTTSYAQRLPMAGIVAASPLITLAVANPTGFAQLVHGLHPDGPNRLPRLKRGRSYGSVLLETGDMDIEAILGTGIQPKSGGIYEARAANRYYVTRKIPRGSYLTFWFQGNPQAINAQDPKGYTALHVEKLVGGATSTVVTDGFKSATATLNKKRLFVFLLIVLALSAAWWVYRQRYG